MHETISTFVGAVADGVVSFLVRNPGDHSTTELVIHLSEDSIIGRDILFLVIGRLAYTRLREYGRRGPVNAKGNHPIIWSFKRGEFI